MTDVPRQKLAELFLEAALTSRPHLIVEGPDDERFFRAWAAAVGADFLTVSSVEDIDIDTDTVLSIGLADGNRGRVVATAKSASDEDVPVICVADRDCGHHVEEHSYETLLWTDFPAIESYAVDEATLDRANDLSLLGKLPKAETLLPPLTFALREIFAVRTQNEHLQGVKHAAGLPKGSSDLSAFDVSRAIDQRLVGELEGYPRSEDPDPRTFAYGHDIADLLLSAFGNAIKNQAGLTHRRALEGALRSAIQVVGTYRSEPMFTRLEHWVRDQAKRSG
ncbi:hypothetical protein [Plantibacter sp. Leaf314]|uniref:hypothetical protein n=1 Tax=Plantibacter sp. Leaf314 TaxID=1736333 RepID=UPI000A53739D|nr:hypothetical protein [Plantibacter sp. Leaf314]